MFEFRCSTRIYKYIFDYFQVTVSLNEQDQLYSSNPSRDILDRKSSDFCYVTKAGNFLTGHPIQMERINQQERDSFIGAKLRAKDMRVLKHLCKKGSYCRADHDIFIIMIDMCVHCSLNLIRRGINSHPLLIALIDGDTETPTSSHPILP